MAAGKTPRPGHSPEWRLRKEPELGTTPRLTALLSSSLQMLSESLAKSKHKSPQFRPGAKLHAPCWPSLLKAKKVTARHIRHAGTQTLRVGNNRPSRRDPWPCHVSAGALQLKISRK